MSESLFAGEPEAIRAAEEGPKVSPPQRSTGRLPVTAVVVNCNGGTSTLTCLRTVSTAEPTPERIVLVDNGSTDGTRALIEKEYQGDVPLTTMWLPSNVGPAAARNIATQGANSEFIAFLDNDTMVCSGWLKVALETAERFDADCIQCKLILGYDHSRLDSLGYLMGPFGFPRLIARPGALDLPEYQQSRLLFGVKSAAMVIRRHTLERVGGFDSDFFIYGEETDLCWRVLRSGGRIVLAPQSVVLHYSGGTVRFLPKEADPLLYRGGTRNYIWMVAKNSPATQALVGVAGQTVIWLGMACLQAFRGRVEATLILLGIWDALTTMPSVIRKRGKSALPYLNVPRELRMPMTVSYAWLTLKELTSNRR